MKNTQKVERFDYTKIESREDLKYFGIHKKCGRVIIDTDRYQEILEEDGIDKFLPVGLFADSNVSYFTPNKVKRHDYKINIFRDLIYKLKNDWFEEYKPIFQTIKSPDEVYNSTFLDALSVTGCSEDYDSVQEEAVMAKIKRIPTYNWILQNLYCSFISKITAEIDRYAFIVMAEMGYKSTDFSMLSFFQFSDGLQKDNNGIKINKLKKYNAYNMLHKINNFLKHNSIDSYNELKKYYPDNVRSLKKDTAKSAYQNGMFAGDWIVIKDEYIDNIFDSLILFFEDYCRKFLNEDMDDSMWNYDEYFLGAYKEIKNLDVYFYKEYGF
ncbi:MAG: hypothetical protein R3Y32_03460 [Bacillota bacterium]